MRQLPLEKNAEQFIDAVDALVISEQDFQRALDLAKDPPKGLENYFFSSPVGEAMRFRAAILAGKANNLDTLGIVTDVEIEEELQYFHGNIFVVVKEPLFDRELKKLQATDYEIAVVELAGTAKWIGKSPKYATKPIEESTRERLNHLQRCCGPNIVGRSASPGVPNTPGGNGGGGDPEGPIYYPTADVGITNDAIKGLEIRTSLGLHVIPLKVFLYRIYAPSLRSTADFGSSDGPGSGGMSFRSFVFQGNYIDPECARVKLNCPPPKGNDGGGSSTDCKENEDVSINGQKVPYLCLVARFPEGEPCLGFSPAGYRKARLEEVNSPFLPRICMYVQFSGPNNPCNQALKDAQNITARVETGWRPGKASEKCQPAGANMEHLSCIKCNEAGNCVTVVVKNPHSPYEEQSGQGDASAAKAEESQNNTEGTEEEQTIIPAGGHYSSLGNTIIGKPLPPSGPEPKIIASPVNQDITPPLPEKKEQIVVFPESEGLFITHQAQKNETANNSLYDQYTSNDKKEPWQPRSPHKKVPKGSVPQPADPVNIGDGSFILQHTDLQFPGPVFPLAFTRNYYSQRSCRSLLGSNWSFNWDVRIVPVTADNAPLWVDPWCYEIHDHTRAVILYDAGNTELYIMDEITKLYLPQSGSFNTITRTSESGWALRTPEGRIRIFDADGYLISDRDRFGNGFKVDYEPTPLFELYQAFCGKGKLTSPAERYGRRFYLLSYLVGEKSRSPYEPLPFDLDSRNLLKESDFLILKNKPHFLHKPIPSPLHPVMPSIGALYPGKAHEVYFTEDQAEFGRLVYARACLLHLAEIASRVGTAGVESIDGFRKKRPVKVEDDLGRTLGFSYYEAAKGSSGRFDFDAMPWAGLLKSVNGPLGTTVTFDYTRPVDYPADLNEAFLCRVVRKDHNFPAPGVEPATDRYYEFEYNFPGKRKPLSYDRCAPDLEMSYFNYYRQILGCKVTYCKNLVQHFGDPSYAALTARNNYISNVSNKIITVINTNNIESETRYAVSPNDENFGKVISQRYGNPQKGKPVKGRGKNIHNLHTQWKTTMPEMTFHYMDAGPVSPQSNADKTDTFLPEVLKRRYEFDQTDVNLFFQNSELKPVDTEQEDGKCDFAQGERMRRKLPGYRPTYQYYEAPGKNYPYFEKPILRTRLTPAQLRAAHITDPGNNDLISGYVEKTIKVPGKTTKKVLVARRSINGRNRTKANSNRICSWVKTVDRDGVVNYYGLNYRGQALVEAVLETDGRYIVMERLVNADGLPIQERGPTYAEDLWTPDKGHTIFRYDEIDPNGNKGWNEWLPAFWTRRRNLVRVEEYAEGGKVNNDDENGNFQAALGRFEEYSYEPLFNQMSYHAKGYLGSPATNQNKQDIKYWESNIIFDYQELSLDPQQPASQSLLPVLSELQKWGYSWVKDANGNIDLEVLKWQLPMPLFGQDLNADDIKGYAFHPSPSQRGRGLPVLIVSNKPGAVTRQVTMLQWAPHGRPSLIIRPDGEVEFFGYYSVKHTASYNPYGSQSMLSLNQVSMGYKGLLGRHSKLRFYEDYPLHYGMGNPPANVFKGPYKWLNLKGGDPVKDMQDMGFAPEVIEDLIATAGIGNGPTDNWIRMEFLYNEGGEIRQVISETGTISLVRDTDGRIKQFTDPIGGNTFRIFNHLGLPLSVKHFDKHGTQIGDNSFEYDNEGRVLKTVEETGQNKQVIHLFDYSPDGNLVQVTDPEGLPTKYRYNSRKQKTGETVHDNTTGDFRGLGHRYNVRGQLVETHYGIENDTQQGLLYETFVYDGLDRMIKWRDKRGTEWLLSYSGRDLPTRYTQPQSKQEVIYYYDEFGFLSSEKVNNFIVASYAWTPGGKLFMKGKIGENPEYTTYDLLGRPAVKRDSNGNVTIFTYRENPYRTGQATIRRSEAGDIAVTSLVAVLDPRGLTISLFSYGKNSMEGNLHLIGRHFEYDGSGNLISDKDHLGHEKRYDSNWLGWKLAEEENTGNPGTADHTVFDYNLRGQLTLITDPKGYEQKQFYNLFGESLGSIYDGQPGIKVSLNRDRLGRIESRVEGNLELFTKWDNKGYAVEEYFYAITGGPSNISKRKETFLTREFDELGRLVKTTHTNPLLATINQSERTVTVRKEYDPLGRLKLEGIKTGSATEITCHSNWFFLNAPGWNRQYYYQSPGWSAHFLDTYDQGGRLVRKSPYAGQKAILDTWFEWMGDWYIGRAQYSAGWQSPFRERKKLDGFGKPFHLDFRVIDVLSNGQPAFQGEGSTYCNGVWNPAKCGQSLLAIDIIRDALGRVGALQWQYGHQLSKPAQSHPRNWRGYAYTPEGYLGAVWEKNGMTGTLNHVPNYLMTKTHIQNFGNQIGAERWDYLRETNVGSPLSIDNAQSGKSRWRIPPNSPRTEGHQLTAVELNGSKYNILHNGLGQIESFGSLHFAYHPYLHQLGAVRDNSAFLEFYLFDAEGRLVSTIQNPGKTSNQKQAYYLYDGLQMAVSFDENAQPQWLATWGPGLDHLIEWTDFAGSGGKTIPLSDHRNSIVSLWQPGVRQLTGLTEYTPEGRIITLDTGYSQVCSEESSGGVCPVANMPGLPFGFSSAWRSGMTGLVWMRNRWYAPALGQFLSHDPAGPVDSYNLYGYVGFDPVNYFDPMGREGWGVARTSAFWEGVGTFSNNFLVAASAVAVVSVAVSPLGIAIAGSVLIYNMGNMALGLSQAIVAAGSGYNEKLHGSSTLPGFVAQNLGVNKKMVFVIDQGSDFLAGKALQKVIIKEVGELAATSMELSMSNIFKEIVGKHDLRIKVAEIIVEDSEQKIKEEERKKIEGGKSGFKK